ncbi:MAG: hypothetical protein ABIP51_16080 [Bacteroidia bacterium]
MKKLTLFLCLAIICFLNESFITGQIKTSAAEIKVEKSAAYKGKEMEALYIAKLETTKVKRYFEVIKTNAALKNFFLADFLLIEKGIDNKILYYPMGWTTDKIKSDEIKANCLLVINGKVSSVKVDS